MKKHKKLLRAAIIAGGAVLALFVVLHVTPELAVRAHALPGSLAPGAQVERAYLVDTMGFTQAQLATLRGAEGLYELRQTGGTTASYAVRRVAFLHFASRLF